MTRAENSQSSIVKVITNLIFLYLHISVANSFCKDSVERIILLDSCMNRMHVEIKDFINVN